MGRLYKQLNKRIIQIQERFIRNSRVFGRPFHLVLESGNICNLKCPLCPTPHREKRIPRGFLSLDNAKKIIDQFPALLHLNLSLWGEPFLNKQIFEIIKYAKSKQIEVLVQSNLNMFDAEAAKSLVESGLDILQLSLDGASQETYEKYRVGGVFADVIKNIELVRARQHELDDYRTKIIWKMVVNRFNEHEKETARSWAERLGVDFTVVEIYTPPHLQEEWKPKEKLDESFTIHTDMVERCYSLWQVATVNFNGDVLPCCSEFSPKDAIGNLFSEPFSAIWNNEKYQDLRRQNRERMHCSACHVDKETNWYTLWMSCAR